MTGVPDAMLRVCALILIAGCAPAAPEAPRSTYDQSRTLDGRIRGLRQTSHAKPAVDISYLLPDLRTELRWPLPPNIHPTLEPQFPIAVQFAASGVAWQDLCARGVVNRISPGSEKAMVEYLSGWCRAANRDVDLAIAALGNVRKKSPRLAEATTLDIANILADAGSAEQAQRVLARVTVGDAALYDVLAATYAEVGAARDASIFNDLALDTLGRPAERCRRLVKRIALEEDATTSVAELARLTTQPVGAPPPDEVCLRMQHVVACWKQPSEICAAYFDDVGIDQKNAVLLTVLYQWPRGRATAEEWRTIAGKAIQSLPVAGAAETAVLALELATSVSPCGPISLNALRADAEIVKAAAHSASLDPRLDALILRGRELCSPS